MGIADSRGTNLGSINSEKRVAVSTEGERLLQATREGLEATRVVWKVFRFRVGKKGRTKRSR